MDAISAKSHQDIELFSLKKPRTRVSNLHLVIEQVTKMVGPDRVKEEQETSYLIHSANSYLDLDRIAKMNGKHSLLKPRTRVTELHLVVEQISKMIGKDRVNEEQKKLFEQAKAEFGQKDRNLIQWAKSYLDKGLIDEAASSINLIKSETKTIVISLLNILLVNDQFDKAFKFYLLLGASRHDYDYLYMIYEGIQLNAEAIRKLENDNPGYKLLFDCFKIKLYRMKKDYENEKVKSLLKSVATKVLEQELPSKIKYFILGNILDDLSHLVYNDIIPNSWDYVEKKGVNPAHMEEEREKLLLNNGDYIFRKLFRQIWELHKQASRERERLYG